MSRTYREQYCLGGLTQAEEATPNGLADIQIPAKARIYAGGRTTSRGMGPGLAPGPILGLGPASGQGANRRCYQARAQPSRRGSEPARSVPSGSRRMISTLHGPSRSPTVLTG